MLIFIILLSKVFIYLIHLAKSLIIAKVKAFECRHLEFFLDKFIQLLISHLCFKLDTSARIRCILTVFWISIKEEGFVVQIQIIQISSFELLIAIIDWSVFVSF